MVEDDGSTPGMVRLAMAERLIHCRRTFDLFGTSPTTSIREISNWWDGFGGCAEPSVCCADKRAVIERCFLMATDPGDLVLDPTCGSGTTAFVAEQWGRRWITIDTSRVALALARARIMGARYPYYLLADSREGQLKEAEVSQSRRRVKPGAWRHPHGFVYERCRTSR